ncbi:MAG: hypothetical protein MUE96_10150 [Bacteroidia bacterium]|jgi:K+-sensing histidine kinase KdpD|nr:hypothetical protein [Bacteroidia bacterium]
MSDQSVSKASIDYTLLSQFAHDTRGPFNGLLGFSELLIKQFDQLSAAQQLDYLSIINQQAIRSYVHTQTFIAWVKCISNNLKILPVTVDSGEFMAALLKLIQPEMSTKEIDLQTQIMAKTTTSDLSVLPLAIANLLNHCLKYATAGIQINLDLLNNEGKAQLIASCTNPETKAMVQPEVKRWLDSASQNPVIQLFYVVLNAHQATITMDDDERTFFKLIW